MRTSVARRAGFTLLEIVIALGLFAAAMAVLSAQVAVGTRAATTADQLSDAIRRCESKMNEASSGVLALASSSGTFEDDAAWNWSLEVRDGAPLELVDVAVKTWRVRKSGDVAVEFAIERWLRDPNSLVDSASTTQQKSGASTGTSSTSTGATSTTGGGAR